MSVDETTTPGSTTDDFNKPLQFHGSYFKYWQQKIKFFLTIKKVAKVLTEEIPVMDEKADKGEQV